MKIICEKCGCEEMSWVHEELSTIGYETGEAVIIEIAECKGCGEEYRIRMDLEIKKLEVLKPVPRSVNIKSLGI